MNIPLFKVYMAEDASEALEPVLKSGYIGQGPKVEEFENCLCRYLGNPCVATVNSGTSALHLALHMVKGRAAGRDEVITTPLTCTATNFPIIANGFKIRWADVDPQTCNVDLQDVRRKIGPNTAAIMVVHWGGYPVDLDELSDIQDQCHELYGYRPAVIEDCAHAFGAEYKGKLLGNHGNVCMFSFQAIKHLTAGDGGCLVSPSYSEHQQTKLLRWYGLDREKSPDMRCEQNVQGWGFKFHMNDIAATIGIQNFAHISDILETHRENGKFYLESLEGIPGITLLEDKPDRASAYWIYTIRVKNRDGFIKKMNEHGIAVSKVHDRNDKHACLHEFRVALPNTDKICSDMICIPSGWWVEQEEREYIVDCIQKGW